MPSKEYSTKDLINMFFPTTTRDSSEILEKRALKNWILPRKPPLNQQQLNDLGSRTQKRLTRDRYEGGPAKRAHKSSNLNNGTPAKVNVTARGTLEIRRRQSNKGTPPTPPKRNTGRIL